jgi:hypothetical protein
MDNILTVTDVMERLQVGRPTATRIIKESGYAVNKKKGQKLLISEEGLQKYLGGQKK